MTVVLDASAALAILLDEPGADEVRRVADGAVISTVNYCEVVEYFSKRQIEEATIRRFIDRLQLSIAPFSQDQAMIAGMMIRDTKPFGLSLGDRACLALAHSLKRPALTSDRAWARLVGAVDIDIRLIR